MNQKETKAVRSAGLILSGWFFIHLLLVSGEGPGLAVACLVLLPGIVFRVSGWFPPVVWRRLLFGMAIVVSALLATSSISSTGLVCGLLAGALLLSPLSPGRAQVILLLACVFLAFLTLQDDGTIDTVFVIVDVAILLLLAQQVHSPSEAEVNVWESAFRSLRLIVPVAVVVTLAFWFFPALSQRTTGAFVGFTGRDVLNPGQASEVRLSRRVAFITTFPADSGVPTFSNLYWRGQVLETNEGLRWSRSAARVNVGPVVNSPPRAREVWRYSQELGANRLLACLERPVSVSATSDSEREIVLQTGDSLFFVLGTSAATLEVVSTAAPAEDPPLKQIDSACLAVPEATSEDEGLRNLVDKLFTNQEGFQQRLSALGSFLASSGFVYSLKPGAMPPVDVSGFLLHRKKGYCEHFAAAAANLLRMGGIPARVVTGFRGGSWNPWLRTITVRDSDAHAWVEAWDANTQQWTRFDPTAYVAPDLSARLEMEREPERWSWYRLVATFLASQADLAGAWIRGNLMTEARHAGIYAAIGASLFLCCLWWFALIRGRGVDEAEICLAKLEKMTFPKLPRRSGETPLGWLRRLSAGFDSADAARQVIVFSEQYEKWVYASNGKGSETAAAMIDSFRRIKAAWHARQFNAGG